VKKIFEQIWELALPYQDKRDDTGHAEVTLGYAQKLVELENGDEDIIIPAIILHDTGYSQMHRETLMTAFTRKRPRKKEMLSIRIQHQNHGVEIAGEILTGVNYPPEKIKEIQEIISQHDTRDGFISKNEGLVRDADKLWRFSEIGFEADIRRSKRSRESECKRQEAELKKPEFIYSESARRMAAEELTLRKLEK